MIEKYDELKIQKSPTKVELFKHIVSNNLPDNLEIRLTFRELWTTTCFT